MKGDFTRDTFDAKNQYSRVLMQQGRVQLDADWNERDDIVNHYLRALARDLIGPHGGPADCLGFEITRESPDDWSESLAEGDFLIGPGRYYVGGILVENTKWVPYTAQPFYRQSTKYCSTLADARFLVYLDVWERHVTHLEDERIREVALGGPDTATRAQIVWQVKVEVVEEDEDLECAAVCHWPPFGSGRLKARARLDKPPVELCTIPPQSRYRGAENHLYRVEIHTSGSATFKWSRENGSVAFKVLGIEASDQSMRVELADLGRDARLSLEVNDWVELTDEDAVLHNRAYALLQVADIDRETMAVTLAGTTEVDTTGRDLVLRRWDHRGDVADDGALPVSENEWITLEDGVQILFEGAKTGEPEREYHTGDFWLIPARTATGDVEWPSELDEHGRPRTDADRNRLPAALPPRGPRHAYAPLALHDPQRELPFEDCRCPFQPLCACPYYGSGEGIGSDLVSPEG